MPDFQAIIHTSYKFCGVITPAGCRENLRRGLTISFRPIETYDKLACLYLLFFYLLFFKVFLINV